MSNIYTDLFELCPLVPLGTGQSLLPNNVQLMNARMDGFVGRGGSTGGNVAYQGITEGLLSPRQVSLRSTVSTGQRVKNSIFWNTPDPNAKIFIGGAFRFSSISPGVDYADRTLIGINSGLTGTTSSSGSVYSIFRNTAILLRSDGSISIGDDHSDIGVLPAETTRYLEASFDPSDGSVDLYIDDVLILQGSMNFSTVESIGFMAAWNGGPDANCLYEIDNIYVNDDTGDHYNGRMGPIAVQWAPLKSEDSVTWIPENAPNNITAVNKNTLDTGSFVRSPSQNDQADLYEIDTDVIDPDKVILGVVSAPYFRKTDIGARSLAAVATDGVNKLERTFADAGLEFAGSSTPLLMPTAPQGGAWDVDKLAACKFGYEVKA